MSKRVKIMIPTALIVIAIFALFNSSQALADNDVQNLPIVKKLAERFNLEEDEVEAVFDDVRHEHHMVMHETLSERLSQAVSDGSLTEDQKNAILAKHDEMQADREAIRWEFADMTADQRREQMQERHEEMLSWADENGIDPKYMHLSSQKGHMRGHKWLGQ